MDNFNEEQEIAQLRLQTRIIRQPRYGRSRLDRYREELISLFKAGATPAQLQRFLRKKRVVVAHSTITRWLQKNGPSN